MSTIASQITSVVTVYSTIYLGVDQRKQHSSESQAFVRGIHRWQMNSPHKGSATRKLFPFDDIIMIFFIYSRISKSHIFSAGHYLDNREANLLN